MEVLSILPASTGAIGVRLLAIQASIRGETCDGGDGYTRYGCRALDLPVVDIADLGRV